MLNIQTKIINTCNDLYHNPIFRMINSGIDETGKFEFQTFSVLVQQNNFAMKVGEFSFTIFSDSIYINIMENKSADPDNKNLNKKNLFKYVGTAIHEVIFKESITRGLNGSVTLDSFPSAALFHYKNGFRVTPEFCRESKLNRFINNKKLIENLNKLISKYDYETKYNLNISENSIISTVQKIFSLLFENLSLLITSNEAGLIASILCSDSISFIIDSIFTYTDYNTIISDGYILDMNNDVLYPMFLSEKAIDELKKKFSNNQDAALEIKEEGKKHVEFDINTLDECTELLKIKNNIYEQLFKTNLFSIEEYFRKILEDEYAFSMRNLFARFNIPRTVKTRQNDSYCVDFKRPRTYLKN